MFQEPNNYKENDHFFFNAESNLEEVCNAPKNKNGVYTVIELREGRITLIYIGYATSGGLYHAIVNDLHINNKPRQIAWPRQMQADNTDALDIYWFVTTGKDDPQTVQLQMLNNHIEYTGQLPKWQTSKNTQQDSGDKELKPEQKETENDFFSDIKQIIESFQQSLSKYLPAMKSEVNSLIESKSTDSKLIEYYLGTLLSLSTHGIGNDLFIQLLEYYKTIDAAGARFYWDEFDEVSE